MLKKINLLVSLISIRHETQLKSESWHRVLLCCEFKKTYFEKALFKNQNVDEK